MPRLFCRCNRISDVVVKNMIISVYLFCFVLLFVFVGDNLSLGHLSGWKAIRKSASNRAAEFMSC